jgi:hypothetical protein
MDTNLIAILITLGIAVLASPVTGQPGSDPRKADRSVARGNTAPVVEGSEILLNK